MTVQNVVSEAIGIAVVFVAPDEQAPFLDIRAADTLQRGLIEAATRKPDVVILDLGLPDSDGIEFIRYFRQWNQAPIIVLSARDNEQDKI